MISYDLIGVQGANVGAVNAEASAGDGVGGVGGAPMDANAAAASEAAAESLNRAVMQLATVATAGAGNQTVTLSSPNLNLTTESRLPSEIALRPIVCETANEPVEVQMPTSILQAAPGANASLPVSVVLFTTAQNMRTLAVTGRNSTGAPTLSPTVSFSLVQSGAELSVSGASQPINVSVPYRPTLANSSDGAAPCVGTPANETEAVLCPSTVECRFWNATLSAWSTDGCVTIASAGGAFTCSCDHLTDFIVFEFPQSGDELLATALSSVAFNSLGRRALECGLNPSRSWESVPEIWGCVFFLLLLAFSLLGNATYHDSIELHNTIALLEGRHKDERRKKQAKADALKAKTAERQLQHQETRRLKRQDTRSLKRQATGKIAPKEYEMGSPPPSPPEDAPEGAEAAPAAASPEPELTVTTVESQPVAFEPEPAAAAAPAPEPPAAALAPEPPAAAPSSAAIAPVAATPAVDGAAALSMLVGSTGAKAVAGGAVENGAARRIQGRWKAAKFAAQAETVAERWHKDVDSVWKRLCLECNRSHTLCAGILYRGSGGYTRAQTCMILINSFAFEAVILLLFYSAPAEGATVINPVGIIFSGTVCGLIVVPTMVSFAWLFHPMTFVRFGRWCLVAFFCWPKWLANCCCRSSGKVTPGTATAEPAKVEGALSRVHAPLDTPPESAPIAADSSSTKQAAPEDAPTFAYVPKEERHFSYESMNDVMIKASLSQSWKRKDWPAVRQILFGWGSNLFLFFAMVFSFMLYGCELFEPRRDPDDPTVGYGDPNDATVAGNTDELILAWFLSAFQRFVLHEPTIILASKGLPILFASAFCMNCCGETIVNLLTTVFTVLMACITEITK